MHVLVRQQKIPFLLEQIRRQCPESLEIEGFGGRAVSKCVWLALVLEKEDGYDLGNVDISTVDEDVARIVIPANKRPEAYNEGGAQVTSAQ